MAKDKVSAKIARDAKVRIAEIEEEFEDRKKKLAQLEKEQSACYIDETGRLVAEEAERIEREMLSEARLAARREILATRFQLIDKAIDSACKSFVSSKGYPALIKRIVTEHGKGGEVLLSPADTKRFKGSSWAAKAGQVSIRGGVIIRKPTHDVNFSLDAAFETLGEELTLELSEILFGKSADISGKK